MRRSLALGMLLLLGAVAYAAGSSKDIKIKGHLIDNACLSANADKPDKAEKIKNHSVSCALMENCRKSGYAVLAEDGNLYKLDAKGNEQVGKLFKMARGNQKGFHVAIEGSLEGDTLHVSKISVVEASAS